jgi:hypothetical protein
MSGNPLVSARVEVPAGCPMAGEVYAEGTVLFTLGGVRDALDRPLTVVFERAALHRFLVVANAMLAEPIPNSGGAP